MTHLRLSHSPDPDDAFMWWPLQSIDGAPPALDTGPFTFEAVLDDIESLNRRAAGGELEITAMSCAQYPHVQEIYEITACGASMGDAYGPKLVARGSVSLQDLAGGRRAVAVPGRRTSAFGALSLMLGPGSFAYEVVPFEQIIERVAGGAFEAGLVIHEGQLTYATAGLHLLADLGQWWSRSRDGLLLPLGVNTIRRDLDKMHGAGARQAVTALLRKSVEHALAHRDESIRHALACARGMDAQLADTFVSMYVNAWTLDFGHRGAEAVRRFLDDLHAAGLVPPVADLSFAGATGAA